MLGVLRLFVELVTNVVIFGYVVAALLTLVRGGGLLHARLQVAEGLLLALNLKVVATLLRTIELTTWTQIGLFAAVFVLRTVLKRVVTWERRELLAGGG
ncbi:DUF1622 domain-containing protein [Deinococcus metallilatus]|uniref:DUF1622 domain-containing protein n=1 Tax=Deinococcus metallilatus TaxID=1211322 RepID=A0AAJ5F5C4_9DEIO|nr:DUF1622 domain-containing protein [Deinococcus metallilatus]MBB5294215.1 putative membrane protein [Deinococcus metallilatus]QBY08994.1 DUF1622 domain-containing protein [Deinococcus metallilatus]RXJ10138.1 DUF1622 domain-containing protein [Deinococcus metallilatus]TLK27925.1 DUF1622 domain-containing protein [Deinococcus metallilatus]GMA16448.1 hypothetical protein GCM10025871_27790 [Deinococcus metallilatus]